MRFEIPELRSRVCGGVYALKRHRQSNSVTVPDRHIEQMLIGCESLNGCGGIPCIVPDVEVACAALVSEVDIRGAPERLPDGSQRALLIRRRLGHTVAVETVKRRTVVPVGVQTVQ